MLTLTQVQQMVASMKSASSNAWEQRQAEDARSMEQAEEAMSSRMKSTAKIQAEEKERRSQSPQSNDTSKVQAGAAATPKGKIDGPKAEDAVAQISQAVGLPVTRKADGTLEVADGPPAPNKQAVYSALSKFIDSGAVLHAVTPDEAPIGPMGDQTVGDDYQTGTVVPDHLQKVDTTPPSNSPQAVTRGELWTRILDEQALRAEFGFSHRTTHDMAGLENVYREQNGQLPIFSEASRSQNGEFSFLFGRKDTISYYLGPDLMERVVTQITVKDGRANVCNYPVK
jgi:hypothetical protein